MARIEFENPQLVITEEQYQLQPGKYVKSTVLSNCEYLGYETPQEAAQNTEETVVFNFGFGEGEHTARTVSKYFAEEREEPGEETLPPAHLLVSVFDPTQVEATVGAINRYAHASGLKDLELALENGLILPSTRLISLGDSQGDGVRWLGIETARARKQLQAHTLQEAPDLISEAGQLHGIGIGSYTYRSIKSQDLKGEYARMKAGQSLLDGDDTADHPGYKADLLELEIERDFGLRFLKVLLTTVPRTILRKNDLTLTEVTPVAMELTKTLVQHWRHFFKELDIPNQYDMSGTILDFASEKPVSSLFGKKDDLVVGNMAVMALALCSTTTEERRQVFDEMMHPDNFDLHFSFVDRAGHTPMASQTGFHEIDLVRRNLRKLSAKKDKQNCSAIR